ncbi:MAG: hypothetical protein ACRD0G_20770 [Acidimicrobiales bacterium]
MTVTEQPAAPAGSSRLRRLTDGVRELRISSRGRFNERILMILGGILAPLGIVLVLLGWGGAANTPNLYEQIPYLISGGLFGLGLVFLGSFFYFAHWMTEVVKEQRAQTATLVEALGRLESSLQNLGHVGGNGAAPAATDSGDDVVLVATQRGTMAHRPDCVVVAGKRGLHEVTADDGLAACKLCDPYGVANVG